MTTTSIRGRKFGPYTPYTRTLRSSKEIGSLVDRESKSLSQTPLDTAEIDFSVDRSPSKKPCVVDPDELCIVSVENNHVEEVTAGVDLAENDVSLSQEQSTSEVNISESTFNDCILTAKVKLEVNSYSSTTEETTHVNDEYYENNVSDVVVFEQSEPAADSTDGTSDDTNNLTPIMYQYSADKKDCTSPDEDINHKNFPSSKYQPTIDKKWNTRRATCSKQLQNVFHVKDVQIILEDIRFIHNFHYSLLLEKAMAHLGLPPKHVASSTKHVSTSKSTHKVVNVTTEASSDAVCNFFEEIVAKKLAKKKEELGIQSTFNDVLSPNVDSPPKKDIPLHVTSPPKNDIPQHVASPTKSINPPHVTSPPKNVNPPHVASPPKNINPWHVATPKNINPPHVASPPKKKFKVIEVTSADDTIVESTPAVTSLSMLDLSSPSLALATTINYCKDSSFATNNINTPVRKRRRRVISSPIKSLPNLNATDSSCKETKSSNQQPSEKPLNNTTRSSELTLLTTVSEDLGSSETVVNNVNEKQDVETVRTVPSHPRLRMKFKQNSNCMPNDSLLSPPQNLSSSNGFQNNATEIPTTKQLSSDKVTASTPVPNHLDIVEIPYSPTCQCNIINCPHVKQSPSPRKRKLLQLNTSLEKENACSPHSSSQYSRPHLLPIKSPKSSRSKLSQIIPSTSVPLQENQVKFENLEPPYFELDSDTLTASHFSSDESAVYLPQVVHISSDSESDGSVNEMFIPKVKDEIKTETNNDVTPNLELSLHDDDGEEEEYRFNVKRQHKTSSKKRVESFISKPIKVPTFLKPSDIKEADTAPNTCGRIIKSITKKQMTKLTKLFDLKRVNIVVEKLQEPTVKQLIELIETRETWSNNAFLLKAGLSQYDIQRLGLSKTRQAKHENYGFRKFVKRRDVFQNLSDTRNSTKKKPKRELEFLKAQKKKMREVILAKRHEEKAKKEQESIRRALLKINARYLNQSTFWNFLNQGLSPSKPIQL